MERLPNERKKGGGCARPYARDTIFPRFRSWRRLRKGHITKIIFSMRLLLAGGFRGERGGTRSGYKGGKGESVIWPTTNEQPRAVMRSPMRDPMRDIDLMVLGDVGASTPLPSTTREHRIQFASRTREPASRLLPLMARTPNVEAEFVFKHFCTLCATLCAGPLISQDLDRTAGSKRAYEGAPLCAILCAGHWFPKI